MKERVEGGNRFKKNTSGGKYGANKSGMSIHRFAKGKSIDMKRIKREKEIERFKKHKALAKYARLCKAEGIVSDRVHIGPPKNTDDNNDDKDNNDKNNNKKVKKDTSKTSYNKALQIAQLKEKEKEQLATERMKRDDDIKQAEKIRKEKSKLHMRRTKKGQPILHNQVHAILQKLQNEKAVSGET